MKAILAGLALASVLASAAHAQRPVELSPNTPPDRPFRAAFWCQWRALVQAMEPYVAQARATYPGAKQRFQAGLPPRHTFFVTTRLQDGDGRIEQVFVVVDSIVGDEIRGRISSELLRVRGYALGQPYSLKESDLLDWMVSRPDGTQEGNVVGHFIETFKPPRCSDG